MTLLERWDMSQEGHPYITDDEIRRALTIAQAVDERMTNPDHRVRLAAETILDRADELLRGKK